MFRELALSAIALCLVACGTDDGHYEDGHSHDDDMNVDHIMALHGDADSGALVFDGSCANSGCHGVDGDSGSAPSLSAAVPEHTDEQLAALIAYGDGNMPAQSSLSDQEIADVIAHVRQAYP